MIFRKVSDVKRERELAERRKHEPLQELSQDHLVRKIFSKFRRNGSYENRGLSGGGSGSSDIEKGPNPETAQTSETTNKSSSPRVAQVNETGTVKCTTKWTVTKDPGDDKENASSPSENVPQSVVKKDIPKTGNRSLSKWSRVLAKEPTIEEEIFTVPAATRGVEEESEYQKILANLVDLRVDLKLEMQRLNCKICRVDDQIGQLIRLVKTPTLPNEKVLQQSPAFVVRPPEFQKNKSLTRKDSLPKRRAKEAAGAVRSMLENEIHEQDKDVSPDVEKNKQQ